MVFKTFLQGVDTRKSCRIFTFLIILNKIKPTKVIQTYKLRPIIDHLNKSFQESYSNEPKQSIDEHMTKFKGRSSMRQYLKMKPIKHGFKWWFRCASSNDYLYEFRLYLGKKQNVEVNLGEGVVIQLSGKLKGTFCTLFFDNFFNSPLLINKLFEENIYAVGTVRSN